MKTYGFDKNAIDTAYHAYREISDFMTTFESPSVKRRRIANKVSQTACGFVVFGDSLILTRENWENLGVWGMSLMCGMTLTGMGISIAGGRKFSSKREYRKEAVLDYMRTYSPRNFCPKGALISEEQHRKSKEKTDRYNQTLANAYSICARAISHGDFHHQIQDITEKIEKDNDSSYKVSEVFRLGIIPYTTNTKFKAY